MARCSTHQKNTSAQDGNAPTDDTPLRTNPPKPEVSEVKPLTVPKKVPISKDWDQVLKVEMEQLVVYPARGKLPTVRCGKPCASAPGAKHNVPVDNDDDNVNKNDGKKKKIMKKNLMVMPVLKWMTHLMIHSLWHMDFLVYKVHHCKQYIKKWGKKMTILKM